MKGYIVTVVENVYEDYSVEAASEDDARTGVEAKIFKGEGPEIPSGPGGGAGDPEVLYVTPRSKLPLSGGDDAEEKNSQGDQREQSSSTPAGES